MKIVKGDIVELCKEGYIMQQVNCKGAMGAGVALAILKKYPIVKTQYIFSCINNRPEELFGTMRKVVVSDNPNIAVYNSYTQFGYGYGKKHTNEEMLVANIKEFDKICIEDGVEGFVPKLIGCGLAGGNPEVIFEALKETNLTVVEFE